jgi:hypothetical protein
MPKPPIGARKPQRWLDGLALHAQPDATRLENKNLYSAVGVLIVLSGAALVVVGYLQHAHVWRLLDPHREAPPPRGR